MDRVKSARGALDAALARRDERDVWRRRHDLLRAASVHVEESVTELAARLDEVSPAASLSRLMVLVRAGRAGGEGGRHDDREAADREAAGLALRARQHTLASLLADLEFTEQQLAAFADADEQVETALQPYLAELARVTPDPYLLTRIEEAGTRLAATRWHLRQTDEALEAGRRVAQTLQQVLDRLDSAETWQAWDTWLGGGLSFSWASYAELTSAGDHLILAQRALAQFGRELEDLRLATLAPGAHTPGLHLFEEWLDTLTHGLNSDDELPGFVGRLAVTRSDVVKAVRDLDERQGALLRAVQDRSRERDALLARATPPELVSRPAGSV